MLHWNNTLNDQSIVLYVSRFYVHVYVAALRDQCSWLGTPSSPGRYSRRLWVGAPTNPHPPHPTCTPTLTPPPTQSDPDTRSTKISRGVRLSALLYRDSYITRLLWYKFYYTSGNAQFFNNTFSSYRKYIWLNISMHISWFSRFINNVIFKLYTGFLSINVIKLLKHSIPCKLKTEIKVQ